MGLIPTLPSCYALVVRRGAVVIVKAFSGRDVGHGARKKIEWCVHTAHKNGWSTAPNPTKLPLSTTPPLRCCTSTTSEHCIRSTLCRNSRDHDFEHCNIASGVNVQGKSALSPKSVRAMVQASGPTRSEQRTLYTTTVEPSMHLCASTSLTMQNPLGGVVVA